MLEIVRYTAQHCDEWNLFVMKSKNGTFLFHRGYMDYHSNRFQDHSLLFYLDGKLYAVLPANERDNTLISHQGLTYGGLVLGTEATTVHVIEIFEELKKYCREHSIQRVVYKAIPWIYNIVPSEEPLYAMHRTCRYHLVERDVSSTIVMAMPLKWKKDRRHGLRLSMDNGVTVARSNDYAAFWRILEENLRVKHGVSPVHSLSEILLLQGRFPENIVLLEAKLEGQMLGGCVAYITQQVVHTQYIAATPQGKRLGVVNALVDALLKMYPNHLYLDFGKSTEKHSDILNEQLIYQKEGFGARAICYDTYEYNL